MFNEIKTILKLLCNLILLFDYEKTTILTMNMTIVNVL